MRNKSWYGTWYAFYFPHSSGLNQLLAEKPAKLFLNENHHITQLEWNEWLEKFGKFSLTFNRKITDERKKYLLLNCAGEEVREIYKSIGQRCGDSYESLVTDLFVHLCGAPSVHYDRYLFRQIKLNNGEDFESYIDRLKVSAAKCNFSDLDSHVIDHVISTCVDGLRHFLLQQPKANLSLENVVHEWKNHQSFQKTADKVDNKLLSENPNDSTSIRKKTKKNKSKNKGRKNKKNHNKNQALCSEGPSLVKRKAGDSGGNGGVVGDGGGNGGVAGDGGGNGGVAGDGGGNSGVAGNGGGNSGVDGGGSLAGNEKETNWHFGWHWLC